ncbi:MAG: hypothetical protein GQ574_08555 [Crocinitomix sp.]|nr:hypothetical protein [Crocinitomix sp.]
MNRISKIIELIDKKQLKLRVNDDQLRISGKTNLLTQEDKEFIADCKPIIIKALKKVELGDDTEYASISKAPSQEDYPVSAAQKRMWYVSQNEEASIAYNTFAVQDLNFELDLDAFEGALNALIERHESLRTVFKLDEKGALRQVILAADKSDFKLHYQDLSTNENGKNVIHELISKDKEKPFDLEKGPVARAILGKLGPANYVFYFNLHHIVGDGVTMGIITQEVLQVYEGLKLKTEVKLPKDRLQYKDFAHWQIQQIESGKYQKHEYFWRNKLQNYATQINLTGIKERPKIKTFNGRSLGTFIDNDLAEQMEMLTQENRSSKFSGMLTVLFILINKLTKEDDLAIGSPVAGRNHEDIKQVVGNFVNTVVHRNQIKKSDTFTTLLKRINFNVLDALEHQMYPFDKLVEELSLKVDFSRNPVFDVMFSYHNYDRLQEQNQQIITPEMSTEIVDNGALTPKLDVLFNCYEVGTGFYLDINYNTDIYEKSQIELFLKQYKKVMKEVLETPEQLIDQISHQTKTAKSLKLKNLQKLKMIKK